MLQHIVIKSLLRDDSHRISSRLFGLGRAGVRLPGKWAADDNQPAAGSSGAGEGWARRLPWRPCPIWRPFIPKKRSHHQTIGSPPKFFDGFFAGFVPNNTTC
jgi:hypothetical protein